MSVDPTAGAGLPVAALLLRQGF